MKRSLLPVLLLALTLPCLAQTSPKPEEPKAPAAAPATPPALTEVESLKLQNLQLKFSVLQTQQRQLEGDYQALVQGITAEHPGFRWDAQTSTLVAIPKPDAGKK